jgi:hypothetical protein
MRRTSRWLLAVALPPVLAACSRSEIGDAVTGSGPAAVAGLKAIRHVRVINLENRGTRRPQQRGQQRRPGLRAGPGLGTQADCPLCSSLGFLPGRASRTREAMAP